MMKTIFTLVSLLLFKTCLAQGTTSYEGIWQDVENSANYYSIHEQGDTVVLIDLPAIEAKRSTLKSAYTGKKADLIMIRVSPEIPATDISGKLQLIFQSATEGMLYPICDTCGVVATRIRKIF